MPSTKEVAVEEKNVLAVLDFEADAGAGLENADSDSYAIPMIKILQSLSPQCDKEDGIKGAESGHFFNTVTNEVYDGTVGIRVIPCYFKHTFIEWVPRTSGGGYVGEYAPTDAVLSTRVRGEKGVDLLPNGNEIQDSRSHYCLLLRDDDTYEPVLLTLAMTQIPASKKWMTRMNNIRKHGRTGNLYNPPTYSHIYRLTTVKRENEKGKWRVLEVNMETEIKDTALYLAAKDFHSKVVEGKVREKHEAPSDQAEYDADIPF